MVDGERLVPGGWHPFDPRAPPDGRHDKLSRFEWVDRWSTGPHAYYLIDFGYSRRLEPHRRILLTGIYGQDDSVPEMSLTVPYDPYPVDVYHVGNMLLKFHAVRTSIVTRICVLTDTSISSNIARVEA